MADFRSRARIPFGYRIVDGKAEIDPEESVILTKYFNLYLGGLSMAEAGHEAGLKCSATTFRNLLKRKEYTGTDYYPAIITVETQERIDAEVERRKLERTPRKKMAKKAVRIYTEFYQKEINTSDPSAAYQMIRPKKH